MSTIPQIYLEGVDDHGFAVDVLEAAQRYDGRQFFPHEVAASCNKAKTLDRCMEVGLGYDEIGPLYTEAGLGAGAFDCTGLVLRSVADVLGADAREFNRNYRHLRQIASLAIRPKAPIPQGYAVVRYGQTMFPLHMGVYFGNEDGRILEATSQTNSVRASTFNWGGTLRILSPLTLAEHLIQPMEE